MVAETREVGLERPQVATGDRAGEGGTDAQGPGIAECPLDEWPVDGQGTGFVEARHPAKLDDRVQQGDEAAGRQDRGGVVGGLGTGRETHRMRPDRLGHLGQQRRQLIITLDRDGRAVECLDGPIRVCEGDQGVEGTDLRPRRHRREQDVGPQRATRVDHGLTAVHAQSLDQRGDGVIRHGHDDQLDLVKERHRLGEGTNTFDPGAKALASFGVPTGHGLDGPAGSGQGHPQGGPDGSGADDADARRLAWLGMVVRVLVVARGLGRAVDPGGSRSIPAAAMAASVSARSRAASSGSSPRAGWSLQIFIGTRPRRTSGRGTLARHECTDPARTAALPAIDPFGARAPLGAGLPDFYRLASLADRIELDAAPVTVKILLENALRHAGHGVVRGEDVETLAAWRAGVPAEAEFPFMPSRVLFQDLTGVPAIVDLAVMRDAMAELGGDAAQVNPLVPADLVIDHSVQVDRFGTPGAFAFNVEREYERNVERYQLLRWAQTAFRDLRIVPPGTGIVHQVNLEFLATVVTERADRDGRARGVPGHARRDRFAHHDDQCARGARLWRGRHRGRGGPARPAAVPAHARTSSACIWSGNCRAARPPRTSSSVVTEMLRSHGVVGAFVEFAGDGLASLSLADRATISNMSPEFGATATLFPIDDETLAYLRLTGRPPERVALIERYAKEQGLWRIPGDGPTFDERLALDLSTVAPAVAGPRRPQDRVELPDLPENFRSAFPTAKPNGATADDLARLTDDGGTTGATDDGSVAIEVGGQAAIIRQGSVAIAAITSCTNTSNPTVMIGAGLLARNAVARGLRVAPTVKTSLAPGSKAVTGLPRGRRAHGPAGDARVRAGRVWLHDMHRQLRSAR